MSDASLSRESEDDGFARRVRSAVAWRWGSQVVAQIVTWASTIMVVRLLQPSDYGLFAMSQVVVTALAFLNGHSFATSLIQTDTVTKRRIGQVFGLLLAFNGVIAILLFAGAPLAAAYYREPLVADMLRVQAVIFLTVPFTSLPSELLAKRLEFRVQAKVNMAAAVLGAGTALALAWFDFGVWALVYAPIVTFVTRAIGLTLAARTFVAPVFDPRGAGDLFRFGGALTICQLFWILQSQSDIFIAGRSFETHDLGLYSESLFLTLIVTGRFLPPINDVSFPAYAELHKTGRPLGSFFLRTLRTVFLVTAPLYTGLALTAEPAVLTLFGPKWVEMAPLVAGLALAMPAMALQIVCSPTTNAMGRPRYYLMTNGAGAILFPTLFLVLVGSGPMGLVHAWWIAAPSLLILTLALTLPQAGLAWGSLLREIAPMALACGVMALGVLAVDAWLRPDFAPARLALDAAVGALLYACTLWLVRPSIMRDTWAMMRHRSIVPAT